MLYFIVGASLSGKTSIRRILQKQYGISGIDTDTLRTMAEQLLPEIGASHRTSLIDNYTRLKPFIDAFLYARSFFPNEDFILEGDALNIKSIIGQPLPAKIVILGYPNASVDTTLALLLQNRSIDHWSVHLSDSELRTKIMEFVEFSEFLRREAQWHKLTFIDTSNTTLDELTSHVKEHFELH